MIWTVFVRLSQLWHINTDEDYDIIKDTFVILIYDKSYIHFQNVFTLYRAFYHSFKLLEVLGSWLFIVCMIYVVVS